MRSWGFNAIRLGVIWAGLEPQRGQIDQDYISHLQAIVALAARERFWVLLDMHQDLYAERFGGRGRARSGRSRTTASRSRRSPATSRSTTPRRRSGARSRASGPTATASAPSTSTRSRRWRKRFAGSPAVLGYDLFNEPSCEFQLGPPCGLIPPDPPVATQFLMPLYDQLVPALNAADPEHPAFYEDSPTVNFRATRSSSARPTGPSGPFRTRASRITCTARPTCAPA